MHSPHCSPLPAHSTKHLPLLCYHIPACCLHLAQLDDGSTNGTALWLGAQCLSFYLADIFKGKPSVRGRPLKAIELGSGVGLSALVLSSMGWDVLATDLPDVISAVLSSNVARNASQLPAHSGVVQVRALDWTVPPDQWVWDNEHSVASLLPLHHSSENEYQTLGPPFDLIISSDTLYAPVTIQPLLRTLHALSIQSIKKATTVPRSPVIYLCIERRDPILVDHALVDAKNVWGFTVDRVPHYKLSRALKKGGAKWDKSDWEGIEIWRLTLTVVVNEEKIDRPRVTSHE